MRTLQKKKKAFTVQSPIFLPSFSLILKSVKHLLALQHVLSYTFNQKFLFFGLFVLWRKKM